MHCLMRFYAFQKGKSHACNARQRRSVKLEGDQLFNCNDEKEKNNSACQKENVGQGNQSGGF